MRGTLWCGAALALAVAGCGGGSGPNEGLDARWTSDGRIPDAVQYDAAPAVFGTPIPLSDPANASFLPAIATRADVVVVAWHDFPGGPSRVLTRAIVDGVPGPIEPVPETFDGPKRPSIATTTGGFVLAYEATDTTAGVIVIRTIDLDADGHAVGTPTTVSAPGASAVVARVAAYGDDVGFAWTDGTAHHFARRGDVETVAATPVGTTLLSGGQLNFPRIAVTSNGELLIAYRDGGVDSVDWDVLLVTKPFGSPFGAPVNVSSTPGLLSDDISLALEADGTLDVVWVDQDPVDVNSFEVTHATRSVTGVISPHDRFGTQGLWSWTPAAIAGMTAVWHTGGGAGGELWIAQTGGTPEPLLAGQTGAAVALARDAAGALHVCYVTPQAPRQVMYARTP